MTRLTPRDTFLGIRELPPRYLIGIVTASPPALASRRWLCAAVTALGTLRFAAGSWLFGGGSVPPSRRFVHYGFAARCEAVAMPRRTETLLIFGGYAPGAGFCPTRRAELAANK
jgi:hypothetical protein